VVAPPGHAAQESKKEEGRIKKRIKKEELRIMKNSQHRTGAPFQTS
jgi:hypothetical protein